MCGTPGGAQTKVPGGPSTVSSPILKVSTPLSTATAFSEMREAPISKFSPSPGIWSVASAIGETVTQPAAAGSVRRKLSRSATRPNQAPSAVSGGNSSGAFSPQFAICGAR